MSEEKVDSVDLRTAVMDQIVGPMDEAELQNTVRFGFILGCLGTIAAGMPLTFPCMRTVLDDLMLGCVMTDYTKDYRLAVEKFGERSARLALDRINGTVRREEAQLRSWIDATERSTADR